MRYCANDPAFLNDGRSTHALNDPAHLVDEFFIRHMKEKRFIIFLWLIIDLVDHYMISLQRIAFAKQDGRPLPLDLLFISNRIGVSRICRLCRPIHLAINAHIGIARDLSQPRRTAIMDQT